MRSQTRRDQQSVTIATALTIFVGTVAAGVLLGALADAVGDVAEGMATLLTIGTLGLAGILSLGYLVRHRRA